MKIWEAATEVTIERIVEDGEATLYVTWMPVAGEGGESLPEVEDAFWGDDDEAYETALGRARLLLSNSGKPLDEVSWFDYDTGDQGPARFFERS